MNFAIVKGMDNDISPHVNEELAKILIRTFYGFQANSIKKLDGYDDLNFHLIPKIVKENSASIVDLCPHGYVFKIINSRESQHTDFIEQYIKVLLHLNKDSFSCPCPIINKNGQYYDYWTDNNQEGPPRRHLIVMLTYIPGEVLANHKCDETVGFSIGSLMSTLHTKLMHFRDISVFKRSNFMWSLESVPKILTLLDSVELSKERRQIVINVVSQFESEVLTKLTEYERGIIHNDVHDKNLIVQRTNDPNNPIKFMGLVDFSDMVYTAYLFDVAIAVCYLALNNTERSIALIASFLRGYNRRSLTENEFEHLKICICARLCQSVIMGLYTYSINPTNEYLLITQQLGWKLLNTLNEMSNQDFINELKNEIGNTSV